MLEKRNDCVGCETCRNCGRDKDYYVHVCDCCGCEADDDNTLYNYRGVECCPMCLIGLLIDDGIVEVIEDDD